MYRKYINFINTVLFKKIPQIHFFSEYCDILILLLIYIYISMRHNYNTSISLTNWNLSSCLYFSLYS